MKKTELKKTIEEAVRVALKESSRSLQEELGHFTKKTKEELLEKLKKKDDAFVRHDQTGEYFHVEPEGIDPDDDVFFWGTDEDGGEHKLPYAAIDIID